MELEDTGLREQSPDGAQGPKSRLSALRERLPDLRLGCTAAHWRCAAKYVCCSLLGSLPVIAFVAAVLPSICVLLSRHFCRFVQPESVGIYEYEFVSFDALDMMLARPLRIAGVHFPAAHPPDACEDEWTRYFDAANANFTVIAVHGTAGSALMDLGYYTVLSCAIRPLLCAGFKVLAIDMRNHGNSSTAMPYSLGYREADDVLAAADWLETTKNVPRSRILLWGESAGAAAVLYAAAREPRFPSAAVVSPPISWGFELPTLIGLAGLPTNAFVVFWVVWWFHLFDFAASGPQNLASEARYVKADVLHAHTTRDPMVTFSSAVALRAALESRHRDSDGVPSYEAYFGDGANHCDACRHDAYRSKLLSFFVRGSARTLASASVM